MIKCITIENVGNIKNATYDLSNKLNVFEADNGVGKTNTLNAISYLLAKRIFSDNGKNENEFTSLIPVDNDRAVSSVFITTESGQEFGFKFYNVYQKTRGTNEEVFKGRTTDYYFNGVKCKNIAEFDFAMNNAFNLDLLKKIKVNDTKFNAMALITDVFYAFAKIDYKLLRELVIYFTGDVSFEDLAKEHPEFNSLKDDVVKYNGRLDLARKNYKSIILDLQKQIDVKDGILKGLDINFDEAKLKDLEAKKTSIEALKQGDLSGSNIALIELQKKVIEAERAYLNSKTNDYQTNQNIKLNEAMELVSVAKEKLHSCEIVLKDYENKLKIINEQGKFNKTKNESLVNELEKLQVELAEVINNPDKCPNCGYILNEEKQQEKIDNLKAKITNLNNQKASLIEDTKKLANDKNELSELIDGANSDLSDLKADLSQKEANLDKVKGEPFNPISEGTNALKNIYLSLKEELNKLEESHNNLEVEIETKYANDLAQINKELEPIMQAKYNLKLYKKTDKEKQELISQLNDAESSYTLCDEYIKTRIKAINDKAYSTFGIEFEMLKEQVNGGLEEVCYPVLDGKAYNQLNRGLKEYLGALFITKIKELTNVKDMPILIDNAESLGSNSLNKIVNMGSQIIATRVVSNKNILELVKE